MDPRIKNATIYFITPTNRILLVRMAHNNKLTTPGGLIERNEHPYAAALREFREETGFRIDPKHITCQYSVVLKHDSGKTKTAFYFIRSTQRFGQYKRSNTDGETVGMIFMDLGTLIQELSSNKSQFVSHFHKYTKKLHEMNLFYPF